MSRFLFYINLLTSFIVAFLFTFLLVSCEGNESDEGEGVITYININANANVQLVGNDFIFTITDNLNNDITSLSTIYVDGEAIEGNTISFEEVGEFQVYAKFQEFESLVLNIRTEFNEGVSFKQRIIYEDFTGTWCGYCPIAFVRYEVLHEQNENVVFVGVHGPANTTDPYSNEASSALDALTGVLGRPKMYINRTIEWPYNYNYTDVSLPLSEIVPFSKIGIAVNSTLSGNSLSGNVDILFSNDYTNTSLVLYLVEDNLYHAQKNYFNGSGGSPVFYDGVTNIPDYYHKNVLRECFTNIAGDAIPNTSSSSGSVYEYNFQESLDSEYNFENLILIAMVLDNEGTVLNVREVPIQSENGYEYL